MDRTHSFGLISVVIPAYNAEKTIDKAIQSAIGQTYPDLEVVIIDDCSQDGTVKIATDYAKTDDRIRVLQNQTNRGVAFSRNRGVEEAKGEWIAFLDSDDRWDMAKLEKQAALLEENPSCPLCFTGSAFENGEGLRCSYTLPVPEKIKYHDLLKQNLISCSSVLVKKEILIKFPMKSDPKIHEDLATWLKILQDGAEAIGIDEPLLIYRISSQSKSGNKLQAARMQWKTYQVAEIGYLKSIRYFITYAWRNIKKYLHIMKNFERVNS